MDTVLHVYPSSLNGFKMDPSSMSSCSNQILVNGDRPSQGIVDLDSSSPESNPQASSIESLSPSSSTSLDGDHPDNSHFAHVVLKYINEMLMEEDLEGQPCMLQDCLAVQAAEKSFYEVIGQKYPPSPDRLSPQSLYQSDNHPDDNILGSSSSDSCDGYIAASNSMESHWMHSEGKLEASHLQASFTDSPQNFTSLPDLENCDCMPFAPKSNLLRPPELGKRYQSPSGSRGRKSYQRDDGGYLEEGRSSKQSALSLTELEQSEMFDQVLLCKGENEQIVSGSLHEKLQSNQRSKGKTRTKRQGKKREVVDLSTLLMQCAQCVSSFDQRTATELLKQIRQHSSQFGDGTQRMAFYFANALEVRMAGAKTPVYSPILSCKTSAAEILQAYEVYVTACPFKKMSNFFANKTIVKLAEKATRLHIIDFGILYGFQWPCLIQRLSSRPNGPPNLRITGIELPQPGFRPAERVQETGHRLKRYCERFNVPFEYNFIAKKWETIKLEDLKIDRDETTVVNCLYRMKNIPDDTMVVNSSRDTVMKLIKEINPDLFVHGVVNGTYNAPFFVTRFREALFHFSSLFDMFEATVPREDQQRMMFEREVFGRDAMNVIACEGTERVERPETYKQWQVRNLRMGFRQLPLDHEILKRVKTMVKSSYHGDFVIDVDGNWINQKGHPQEYHA
ncbi:scarecrow-like protein 30 [Carica papaya]|uniref:scarecrow-like protein 30 n=1 Tax=Carica papaya TaxID=3649 RepID=UPI000B8D1B8D|nr:scarecrow-like protein 30 [Carica papaya]